MSYTPKNNFNLKMIKTTDTVPVYTPENNSNLQLKRTGAGDVGFRKKLLKDVACCDKTDYQFYGGFQVSAPTDFSKEITIRGGCSDFNWEIGDSYFSFVDATTTGRTNTIIADGSTPSGHTAVATITDSCGNKRYLAISLIGLICGIHEIGVRECDPSICTCGEVEIGYTTQQMSVSEGQNLSVENAVAGCIYRWEITSGGGSLSSSTGTSVTYTAPSSNENCDQNSIISLSVEGNVCDTLALAITDVNYLRAYLTWDHPGTVTRSSGKCWCYYDRRKWSCKDEDSGIDCYDAYKVDLGGCDADDPRIGGPCLDSPPEEPLDMRTAAMITNGCCPAALL